MSVNGAQRDQTHAQETTALRLALTGLAGASVEWYDFLLYATAAALVFPTVFFPARLSPFVALIASFSTFAVGFVARPVGAILFGQIGDRLGRKAAFAVALTVMGSATTLIGLVPSYRTAGIFSPLALVLLRFAQGLAVGGQWGGATLLATESAPSSRRGLYGSIAQAGISVGIILSTLAFLAVNSAMSPEAFMAYGWRIPFLLSVALIGLSIFVHFRIQDTAAFRDLRQSKSPAADLPAGGATLDAAMRDHRSPIIEALRLYPKLILVAAGAYAANNVVFYVGITYVVAYGTSPAGLHLPRNTLLGAVLIAQFAAIPAILVAGALSDRFGRRRIFTTGVALSGVWAFILFPLIETRSFLWISVAISVGGCWSCLTYGPLAAMFAEMFSTHVRYSACSLAYQIAAILGGALAPIIATGLYARYHSNVSISIYMGAACALSLVCASRLRKTRKTDLDEYTEPTAAVVST